MLIPLETVNSFIHEHFENVKVSRNGTHFLARCALCGDSKTSQSKRRFNLDYKDGAPVYQCFNCGKSGSFIHLYALINSISYEEARRVFTKFDSANIRKSFKRKTVRKPIVVKSVVTYHDSVLNDCISVDSEVDGIILPKYQEKLKEFIRNRNTFGYKLYIAYQGKYKGRVIIPICDENNHIIYFQGRTLFDDPKKYDNPPTEKSQILFNSHKFDRNKFIVITEGIFDALTIGDQGTTCFGASISDEFLQKLFEMTNQGIIIALDNDERGLLETNKILLNSKYSKNLRYFLMPDGFRENKDINMLDGKVKNIYDFILNNAYSKFEYSISAKLRRK